MLRLPGQRLIRIGLRTLLRSETDSHPSCRRKNRNAICVSLSCGAVSEQIGSKTCSDAESEAGEQKRRSAHETVGDVGCTHPPAAAPPTLLPSFLSFSCFSRSSSVCGDPGCCCCCCCGPPADVEVEGPNPKRPPIPLGAVAAASAAAGAAAGGALDPDVQRACTGAYVFFSGGGEATVSL